MIFADEQGYLDGCEIGDHGEVAIMPLMYTYAIVSGLNAYGYEDRWCYSNYAKAKKALEDWKQNPEAEEPEGWHRHPATGRRRPDGDKSREEINF